MLTNLRISGLGVIDSAVLELGPGLTVVTGETGAGKTMVVTGLGLIAGGRTEARAVRTGSARALVEARFVGIAEPLQALVDEAGGMLDDDELLICRQVAAAGRSRAMLGGAQVPLSVAAEVGGALITIHGQSEQQRLATAERQRHVLDRAAGPLLAGVMERYQITYEQRRTAMAELTRLQAEARERAREQDLLRFGLDEIAAVDPQPGEDQALEAEARRLQAVDDLRLAAREAALALAGDDDTAEDAVSALSQAAAARKALERAADSDPAAAGLAHQAREVTALLADLATATSSYLADLDADPVRLEWVASRRAALQALTRKYGETVDEVLAWAAQAAQRLQELHNSDERIETLEQSVAGLSHQISVDATEITRLRQEAADRLAAAVQVELSALAMPRARLDFNLSPLAEPGPYGADMVHLRFSANPGSAPGPLAAVASGGELSRVRLALEVVLADAEAGQTFVFDEVDAGVGGAVALEVGRRLAALAASSQVIVVTHLAQVAAFADRHLVVAKADDGCVTASSLSEVTGEKRRAELARMMSGITSTASALAHADELIVQANQSRSSANNSRK